MSTNAGGRCSPSRGPGAGNARDKLHVNPPAAAYTAIAVWKNRKACPLRVVSEVWAGSMSCMTTRVTQHEQLEKVSGRIIIAIGVQQGYPRFQVPNPTGPVTINRDERPSVSNTVHSPKEKIMSLHQRTAIVTGGGVRVGRALAVALAREGARVVVHYGSSRQAAEETVAEIVHAGGEAIAVQADLREPATAAETIFKSARDAFGTVDMLINSAAIFEAGGLAEVNEDIWRRHFAINLESPCRLCQAFAKQFPHHGESPGHIVNIVDWRGTRPGDTHLVYTLTKAGLVAMTKALAQELAPSIRVNGVAPGAVLPPPGGDESQLHAAAQDNVLKQPGCPGDIADAVLYLVNSSFVTGEVIHVAGGSQL